MRDDQREQVRHNAKYLQEVRPIDPGEINEYVEGQPHPAAVRQVLRDAATDLSLIERADGTFVPVPEGPVEAAFRGVEQFPEDYTRVLEDALLERFGRGWPDGTSGDRLRARIREVKERYLRGLEVDYDEVTALGYAVYHLPGTYASVQYVLADLVDDGEMPTDLRVLDVGAGVGGPALGLHDLLPGESLVEYHAVEPSGAADLLERFLDETGRNFHPSVHRTSAQAFEPTGEYDLVMFANVLSELENPAAVVDRYLDALAGRGSVLALAPADRNTATNLRAVERELEREAGSTVYAPTVRLWPGETPESECWSFDAKPDLAVPPFQKRLDEGQRTSASPATEQRNTTHRSEPDRPGDGEFVNVDVQYAFGIWRPDDSSRIAYRPDPDRTAKMAETGILVTERVDIAGIKLSHDLSEGENSLYLVGDGSERTDHFAVLTRGSGLNRDLATAGYGDCLRFENALVLWNDDEGAYNLVVDGETVVDRLSY